MKFEHRLAESPRIMVVDDDKLIQNLYEESFKTVGYQTFVCGDGFTALNNADIFNPDILIADLKMPDMNGIELLDKMKRKRHDIEVIIVTAHADMESSITSFRYGAVDFLTKPVRMREMLLSCERAMERIKLKIMQSAPRRESIQQIEDLITTYSSEQSHIWETINNKLAKIVYPQIDYFISVTKQKECRNNLLFVKKLLESIFPFAANHLSGVYSKLTPVEIRICNMIIQWKSAQDISDELHLSVHTVYDHQKKIRGKLGLTRNKGSLGTYLRSKMYPDGE